MPPAPWSWSWSCAPSWSCPCPSMIDPLELFPCQMFRNEQLPWKPAVVKGWERSGPVSLQGRDDVVVQAVRPGEVHALEHVATLQAQCTARALVLGQLG